MNDKKSIGILVTSIVASVVITLLVGTLFGTPVKEIVNNVPGFGAVPTLDGVDNPNITIGGKKSREVSQSLAATSSVLCSMSFADMGTTTLREFSLYVATSSISRTEFVTLSTSSSKNFSAGNYGSSTNNWMKVSLPANGNNFSVNWQPNSATTTGNITGAGLSTLDSTLWAGATASGTSAYIIKPSEFLNVVIGTTTAGTFATFPQGNCSARVNKY